MGETILDMHAHLAALGEECQDLTQQEKYEYGIQELNLRRSQNTAAFFSCGNLLEWEFATELLRKGEVGTKDAYLSFGIHPWYSSGYVSQCITAFREKSGPLWERYRKCDVIGEIGMDSVWCDIPLSIQREVFSCQLQIAEVLGKPVILHTKGQEREIAELICGFQGNICVHWYSGDIETLEKFIQMGCWFTLGPDIRKAVSDKWNECAMPDVAGSDKASAELYQYMLAHIPENRLFLETDGISAVAWARGVSELPLEEIPAVLGENLTYLAACKGMSEEEMKRRMWRNLERFLGQREIR